MPESPRGMALDHPYHKDRFTYHADSDTYRCPQGQVLSLVRACPASTIPTDRVAGQWATDAIAEQ